MNVVQCLYFDAFEFTHHIQRGSLLVATFFYL
jgi:hypothetical protein